MKENTWAMLCHLTALTLFVGLPFGNLVGPLIVWVLKKDSMPLVDSQGKESLNFQLSMTLYLLAAGILTFILIGFPLLALLIVADLVVVVMATVKASAGEAYRYPLSIRFIK